MVKKILRIIVALLGMILGYGIISFLYSKSILIINGNVLRYLIYGAAIFLGGILFYIISPYIFNKIEKLIDRIDEFVVSQPKDSMMVGAIGLISGIIIAFILSSPIQSLVLPVFLQSLRTLLIIAIYAILGSLGYRFALKYKDDIVRIFERKKLLDEKPERKLTNRKKNEGEVTAKLLDTSVLIDGRIQAIAETGFIEGEIIVPNFVLEELQIIADSSDDLKRERGRRGLDIVNNLKKSNKIKFRNSDRDYDDTNEVDIKLLKYATDAGATVITNDFNLNKLAIVQGIKVLNINDLANSVKTVVIPGEKMLVNIVKEGKEKDQGLAYLEDGTMIVIEDGNHLIGQHVEVVVSTVLQTAAGKMIFTKLANN